MNKCPSGFTGWDCSECKSCPPLLEAISDHKPRLDVCSNTGYPECNGHGSCEVTGGTPQCVCRPGYSLGPNGDCQFGMLFWSLAFLPMLSLLIFPYRLSNMYVEWMFRKRNMQNRSRHPYMWMRTILLWPRLFNWFLLFHPRQLFSKSDQSRFLGTCPGYPLACSGQGICQNNGTCNCSSEFEGADCSVPICPSSNGINCNDHGFCNDSSSPFFCQCFEGWSGTACEKGNFNHCFICLVIHFLSLFSNMSEWMFREWILWWNSFTSSMPLQSLLCWGWLSFLDHQRKWFSRCTHYCHRCCKWRWRGLCHNLGRRNYYRVLCSIMLQTGLDE